MLFHGIWLQLFPNKFGRLSLGVVTGQWGSEGRGPKIIFCKRQRFSRMDNRILESFESYEHIIYEYICTYLNLKLFGLN